MVGIQIFGNQQAVQKDKEKGNMVESLRDIEDQIQKSQTWFQMSSCRKEQVGNGENVMK